MSNSALTFRTASSSDIDAMHRVRIAVKENTLSDPLRITAADYLEMMEKRGKAWVCTSENVVVGFAVVDITLQNIWALFVDPPFEKKGIGKKLQSLMLDYYFLQTDCEMVWLSTSPETRAEKFYRLTGWIETNLTDEGEIRFEMLRKNWLAKSSG